jgi:tetratricopeptide (TPR) repeat protein
MKLKTHSALLVCLAILFASSSLSAQDTLYRIKKSGKVSRQPGKIEEISPLSVTFKGRSGSEKVPVWEIQKLVSGDEPSEIERARDRIDASRFDDAIEMLEQVTTGSNPVTDAEVGYYKALAMGELAFSGGSYSAVEAGSATQKFLKANPKSHHFVPATDLMGRLAMANGNLDFANKQFALLTKSQWPEYVARGHFLAGEAKMREKKYVEAAAAYEKVIALQANDDTTQRYKQLAQCQKAKVDALAGDPAESIAKLESIIKQEDPDDKELFAYAYNALGVCYLKANDLAEAEEKFLFTHLLFDTEAAPHAEAVYQLAKIWNDRKQTDRASEARQILKSRYRNTWWSSQPN